MAHTSYTSFFDENELNACSSPLSLDAYVECRSVPCNKVSNIYGMLQIKCPDKPNNNNQPTPVDFVVVVDTSSSMKHNKKLAFVQATIEYMLDKLSEESSNQQQPHRFCLISFNEQATMLTDGLVPLTPSNTEKIIHQLSEMTARGSTNISDALFMALEVLSSVNKYNQFVCRESTTNGDSNHNNNSPQNSPSSPVASVMLFTDGLANVGLRGSALQDTLKSFVIPSQVTINTFGFGTEHDSALLQAIALSSCNGVYYYIPDTPCIPSTFGECLAGILHTVVYDVTVRVTGHDGCRMIKLCTSMKVKENTPCKDYTVHVGSMRLAETKSLLFKLSLRNMQQPLDLHRLLSFHVTYKCHNNNTTATDHQEAIIGSEDGQCVSTVLSVSRPSPQQTLYHPSSPSVHGTGHPSSLSSHNNSNNTCPLLLDESINRWNAANAIQEAASIAYHKENSSESSLNHHDNASSSACCAVEAHRTIEKAMESIRQSLSANGSYCCALLRDLEDCRQNLVKSGSSAELSNAIHRCHAYSTMYFQERSTGLATLNVVLPAIEPLTPHDDSKDEDYYYGYRSSRTNYHNNNNNNSGSDHDPAYSSLKRSDNHSNSAAAGYLTDYQEKEAKDAIERSNELLHHYTHPHGSPSPSSPSIRTSNRIVVAANNNNRNHQNRAVAINEEDSSFTTMESIGKPVGRSFSFSAIPKSSPLHGEKKQLSCSSDSAFRLSSPTTIDLRSSSSNFLRSSLEDSCAF